MRKEILPTLWEYAVATYQRADVAAACLAMQERSGADVNLLLTASWLAQRGCRWRDEDVEALARHCAGWRERCVLPLREVRRYLGADDGAAGLYRQAKRLELAAERRQLQMIEAWLAERPPLADGDAGEEVLRHNLACYLGSLARVADTDRLALLAALSGSASAIDPAGDR
jgi:uncharacterized protein (TIGR02444 family)